MSKILYVLKKGGLNTEVYAKLLHYFERYRIPIINSYIIELGRKKKFCQAFYKEKYEDFQDDIVSSYGTYTVALIVIFKDEQLVQKLHLKIKYKLRQRYGMNVIHCSDDPESASREITIILDRNNRATFNKGHFDRSYEDRLISKMNLRRS